MDASELYDTDFVAWTAQQAQALRQLSASSRLDIAHLAEEIEDLGKRDVREVENLIENVLLHVLKIHVSPNDAAVPHWRSEIVAMQRSARRAWTPSMRQMIDVGDLWAGAVDRAVAGWPRLPRLATSASARQDGCPVILDQAVAASLDIDEFLGRFDGVKRMHPEA